MSEAGRGATIYDTDDGGMVFDEPSGIVQRVVFTGFGLTTLLAPWELLIRPRGSIFTLGMLPFWFISLGALSIGVPMIVGGVLGLSRRLEFDFRARRVIERGKGAFGIAFASVRDLDRIATVDVAENAWSDGPSEWDVVLRFADGAKPWSVRRLTTEAAARALAEEILARMGRGATGGSVEPFDVVERR